MKSLHENKKEVEKKKEERITNNIYYSLHFLFGTPPVFLILYVFQLFSQFFICILRDTTSFSDFVCFSVILSIFYLYFTGQQ